MERRITWTEAKSMTYQELIEVNEAINEYMDRQEKMIEENKKQQKRDIARMRQRNKVAGGSRRGRR